MEEEIVKKYTEDLVGSVKLSREFGISKYKILKILRDHGVKARKERRPDLSTDEMIRLYDSGLNTWEIAKEMNTDQTTVRKRIKKSGRVLELSSEQSSKRVGTKNPKWSGYEEISGSYWGIIVVGAKNRSILVEITIEQAWQKFLDQNRKCALSGKELVFAENNKGLITGKQTASLDRSDSSQSYNIDNIQWVTKEINLSKWHFDQKLYLDMCRLVASHAKTK